MSGILIGADGVCLLGKRRPHGDLVLAAIDRVAVAAA